MSEDNEKKGINIEGDVSAWLANVGGTIIVHGDLTLNQWREQQPDELRARTNNPIFISYSRINANFARKLYVKLRALGFTLWRDRTEMVGGENWWAQIQDAIRGSETMVLCMSPESLASPVVADELHYARREGTHVIPVLAADVDFSNVTRWMTKLDWLDFRESSPEHDTIWAKFIDQINTPHQRRPIPFNVPSLPRHFVERPEVFEPLLLQLLDSDRQNPVAITTALKGAGGFGKTTLAMALCHDQRVRDAYDDGVLWVEFGEQPDVLRLLNVQIRQLGGAGIEREINDASTKLRDLLEDKDILLVLDDVWNALHARPFIQRTEKTRTTFLVTTRLQDVIIGTEATQPVLVDEMTREQSVNLLSAGLANTDAQVESLEALAERLGEWALILELANGNLRRQASRYPLEEAIRRVNEDLDDEGFTVFDAKDLNARNQAIMQSLNVSLNLLEPDECEHFTETSICREDTDVPMTTLAALWGMSERKALRLCEKLADLSLIRFDSIMKTVRLHDVIRDVLYRRLNDPAKIHVRLIDNLDNLTNLPDEYTWRNIAYHLVEGKRSDYLKQLLLDYRYLFAKLNATDPNGIISDCGFVLDDAIIWLLQSAVRMSAHVLKSSPSSLSDHLLGRFFAYRDNEQILKLLESVPPNPHIRLLNPPAYEPAGSTRLYTLEGHKDYVTSVVTFRMQNHNFAISGSYDKSLILWNLSTNEIVHKLVGHEGVVRDVAVAPEKAIAISVGTDKKLLSWDLKTGKQVDVIELQSDVFYRVCIDSSGHIGVSVSPILVWNIEGLGTISPEFSILESHTDLIFSVAITPDGKRVISASPDNTLIVWDMNIRKPVFAPLVGHSDTILGVAITNDGSRAISASADKTLIYWDVAKGIPIHVLKGHSDEVNCVAITPDGKRAVSGSDDHTLIVWDLMTGQKIQVYEEHTREVNDVAITTDGTQAVSASGDYTLNVWSLQSYVSEVPRKDAHIFIPHGSSVADVAVTRDGAKAISASSDRTLIVWDMATMQKLHVLNEHKSSVTSVAISSDNNFMLSGSFDNTLIMWDLASYQIIHRFEGHRDGIRGLALTPDNRMVVSASEDRSIIVWELSSGRPIHTLRGHQMAVRDVIITPDGTTAISASMDHGIIGWNLENGHQTHYFRGHQGGVLGLTITPDGTKLISASVDKKIIVWDIYNQAPIGVLEGHTNDVRSVAVTTDGKYIVSVSWDRSLIVWRLSSGQPVARFDFDHSCGRIALSADNKTIITGDQRGHVLFLQWSPDD